MVNVSKKSTYEVPVTRVRVTAIQPSRSTRSVASSKPLPILKDDLPSPPPDVPIKRHMSLPRQRVTTSATSTQKPTAAPSNNKTNLDSKRKRSHTSPVVKSTNSDGSWKPKKPSRQSSSVPRSFKVQVCETLKRPLTPHKNTGSVRSVKHEETERSPSPRFMGAKNRSYFLERKVKPAQPPTGDVVVVVPSNMTSWRPHPENKKASLRSRLPSTSAMVKQLPLKATSVGKSASRAVRSLDAFISHSHKIIRGQGTLAIRREMSPRRARPTETKKLSLVPSRDNVAPKSEREPRKAQRHSRVHGAVRDGENITQRGRTAMREHAKHTIKSDARPVRPTNGRPSSDRNYVPKQSRPVMSAVSTNKQLPARPKPSQEFSIPIRRSGQDVLEQPRLSRQSSSSSAYSIVIQPSSLKADSPINEKLKVGSATKYIMDEDLPPRIRRIMLQARGRNGHDRSNTFTSTAVCEADSDSGSSGSSHGSLDPDDGNLLSFMRPDEKSGFHDDVTLAIEALRTFDRTGYGGLGSMAI